MGDNVLFLSPIYAPVRGGASRDYKLIIPIVLSAVSGKGMLLTCYASDEDLVYKEEDLLLLRFLIPPSEIGESLTKLKLLYNYLVTALVVLYAYLEGVNIVHTHAEPYFTGACKLADWLGMKIIIEGKDLGSPDFSAQGDVFVAGSQNVKQKAQILRDETVTYIPIPMREIASTSGSPPVDSHLPYIIFVGDITSRKGVPELLTAFSDIENNLNLLLIGEPVEENIIEDLPSDVYYLGTVPHKEVLQYLQHSEFLILPSKEEALGRVVLEAIAVGTPAICPPDVPEFETKLAPAVLEEVSPGAIQEKIHQFDQEEDPADSYPVESHYVSNVENEYISLYNSLYN